MCRDARGRVAERVENGPNAAGLDFTVKRHDQNRVGGRQRGARAGEGLVGVAFDVDFHEVGRSDFAGGYKVVKPEQAHA